MYETAANGAKVPALGMLFFFCMTNGSRKGDPKTGGQRAATSGSTQSSSGKSRQEQTRQQQKSQ